jgi:L-2,4-diaminobutyric acid acetyltransferase
MNLRHPHTEDGVGIYNLVADCPPLDQNSRYCNLLQASHFRDTSIVAESNGTLMGMITGYCIPGREHVLFVWQVAVGPQARGEGLAVKMLTGLLDRLPHVTRLEATVTPGNRASERLFERVAQLKGAPVDRTVGFRSDTHFQSEHDDEMLFSIGPFRSTPSPSQTIGV